MKGRTETTDSLPRPDFPIAILHKDPLKITPYFPKSIQVARKSGGTRCKRVGKFSKETGILIKIYASVEKAANAVRSSSTNIAKTARGEQKSAAGYLWKYIDKSGD